MTLLAIVGLVVVRVGCGNTSSLHLRQDITVVADVAWTAMWWVGDNQDKKQQLKLLVHVCHLKHMMGSLFYNATGGLDEHAAVSRCMHGYL